ncbi:hypothetical protein LQ318_07790 [Aliifodinibius salicampi]|uniref:Divergent polysaccharide deacetylase n=1 Tax=Fodinibius salicampi TaxID=1920655 RepID=A0ABT3PY90_9BACT|nr:hypothetical protein [Fodinibius salicampi]MCW9712803.1 hypothetical protein [Fodinibius salicampi]
MKEQKKKVIVVFLLLISCIISGYLFITVETSTKSLRSFSQADSLIQNEFTNFSINNSQIRQYSAQAGSSFSRKIYQARLPEEQSKTQFHADLNRTFYPYDIATPGKVNIADEIVQIHLLYEDIIFRTIKLETDSDLTLQQNKVSIILAFNAIPSSNILSQLTSLGEPIPILLSIEHPMQAKEFQEQLSGQYNRLIFRLYNEYNEDLIQTNPSIARRRVNQFEEILPNAHLLLNANSNNSQNIIEQSDLSFIEAQSALQLHHNLGKAVFLDELNKLKPGAAHSLAIINGNATTLGWLEEKLPELKRSGVQIVPPDQRGF